MCMFIQGIILSARMFEHIHERFLYPTTEKDFVFMGTGRGVEQVEFVVLSGGMRSVNHTASTLQCHM